MTDARRKQEEYLRSRFELAQALAMTPPSLSLTETPASTDAGLNVGVLRSKQVHTKRVEIPPNTDNLEKWYE